MKIYKSYTLKNIFKTLFFTLSIVILLVFSKENFECVKSSLSIFMSSIIPSLFPFIFFTEIILNTNILTAVQKVTGNIFSKIFHISKEASPSIITGFLCGFPMGAKTISKLYSKNQISKYEANKLLIFINNCNPAFLISTIGISIFKNIKIGILLAISHYLSSFIIGILCTRLSINNIIHENISNLNSLNKNNYIKDKNIFEIIKRCIKDSFLTLIMILGFMIIFNLIFNIIKHYLIILNINIVLIDTLSGIFEVTTGIVNLFNNQYLDISIKVILSSFLLGFSGFCILAQLYSTISQEKLSLKLLLIGKFFQGILSMMITYILITYTEYFNLKTISAYSCIDDNLRQNYIYNMKLSYLISTFIIIFFIIIYYTIQKKVAYKNIGHKKEGG